MTSTDREFRKAIKTLTPTPLVPDSTPSTEPERDTSNAVMYLNNEEKKISYAPMLKEYTTSSKTAFTRFEEMELWHMSDKLKLNAEVIAKILNKDEKTTMKRLLYVQERELDELDSTDEEDDLSPPKYNTLRRVERSVQVSKNGTEEILTTRTVKRYVNGCEVRELVECDPYENTRVTPPYQTGYEDDGESRIFEVEDKNEDSVIDGNNEGEDDDEDDIDSTQEDGEEEDDSREEKEQYDNEDEDGEYDDDGTPWYEMDWSQFEVKDPNDPKYLAWRARFADKIKQQEKEVRRLTREYIKDFMPDEAEKLLPKYASPSTSTSSSKAISSSSSSSSSKEEGEIIPTTSDFTALSSRKRAASISPDSLRSQSIPPTSSTTVSISTSSTSEDPSHTTYNFTNSSSSSSTNPAKRLKLVMTPSPQEDVADAELTLLRKPIYNFRSPLTNLFRSINDGTFDQRYDTDVSMSEEEKEKEKEQKEEVDRGKRKKKRTIDQELVATYLKRGELSPDTVRILMDDEMEVKRLLEFS